MLVEIGERLGGGHGRGVIPRVELEHLAIVFGGSGKVLCPRVRRGQVEVRAGQSRMGLNHLRENADGLVEAPFPGVGRAYHRGNLVTLGIDAARSLQNSDGRGRATLLHADPCHAEERLGGFWPEIDRAGNRHLRGIRVGDFQQHEPPSKIRLERGGVELRGNRELSRGLAGLGRLGQQEPEVESRLPVVRVKAD